MNKNIQLLSFKIRYRSNSEKRQEISLSLFNIIQKSNSYEYEITWNPKNRAVYMLYN